MNQNQLAELFCTSKQSISYHVYSIISEKELDANSVVKEYLTTAADGKQYGVIFYSLAMILAIGFLWISARRAAHTAEHLTAPRGAYSLTLLLDFSARELP